ncbi:MAG: hypothetical protein ACLFPW_09920 [Spirochaetaceae bacterium]
MNQPTAILTTVLFFYVLVPGVGAFVVRGRWRRFRRRIVESSLMPILSYAALRTGRSAAFRFYGRLEAVQGDHRVWLSDGHLSVALELEGVSIYAVPAVEPGGRGGLGRDETPRVQSWESLGSLPEGTPFFVAGELEFTEGGPVFRESPETALFVILYEENERRLLARAIWCGRQRNEYWNQFTPVALAAGFVAQLLLAYLFFREGGRIYGLTAVTMALLPALPLMPPGVVSFFGYRRLWGRGRLLRARRDLVRLPGRFDFVATGSGNSEWMAELPSGGVYIKELCERATSIPGYPVRRGVEDEERWFKFYPIYGEGGIRDPWAESVVITGEPERVARRAERRARDLELISLLLFGSSILINGYLAFLALSYLL